MKRLIFTLVLGVAVSCSAQNFHKEIPLEGKSYDQMKQELKAELEKAFGTTCEAVAVWNKVDLDTDLWNIEAICVIPKASEKKSERPQKSEPKQTPKGGTTS